MNSGKEPACDAGNLGSIPRLERSPGGGPGNPLQYPLPGEFHGQRSLAGYNPQGLTELDMTEATKQQQTIIQPCYYFHNLGNVQLEWIFSVTSRILELII